MPGNRTSMEYCAVPFTFSGRSRRGTERPVRRKSLCVLSSLLSMLGSVAVIALDARLLPRTTHLNTLGQPVGHNRDRANYSVVSIGYHVGWRREWDSNPRY